MIPAGTIVGDYELLSRLGESGLGELYKARDLRNGGVVALRLLPPHFLSKVERVDRFREDARAATALGDPRIAAFYDLGAAPLGQQSAYFVATELVTGETFREKLNRRTDQWSLLTWLVSAAEAIERAHSVGVVHRHLSPENIVITPKRRVKILGFGFAHLLDPVMPQLTESDSRRLRFTTDAAAPGYMSPEQLDERPVDHRSDIFSFGCLLFECLTGKPAFRGASAIDTMHSVLHDEPVYGELADYPRYILRKCLQKRPDYRYSTIGELISDLRVVTVSVAPRPIGIGRHVAAFLLAIAAVGGSIATGLVVRERMYAAVPPPISRTERLTYTSDVVDADIAPNGAFVAVVRRGRPLGRLSIRQLDTGLENVITNAVAPTEDAVAVSHDGRAIYYRQPDTGNGEVMNLIRIDLVGGETKRVLSGVDSAPTFSPDGRQMAYVRCGVRTPWPRACKLVIANGRGQGEQTLFANEDGWLRTPSWSPDGQKIALESLSASRETEIISVSTSDGQPTVLVAGDAHWPCWISGSRELAYIRSRGPSGFGDLWIHDVQTGSERRLTRDASEYTSCSTTAGGRLVAVMRSRLRSIWTMRAGAEDSLRRVTASVAGRQDGVGVAWSFDGRIVYGSYTGTSELWIVGADGSGAKRLLSEGLPERVSDSFDPVASPTGATAAIRARGRSVALISLLDGTVTPLTDHSTDKHFRFSPDGRQLYFSYVRHGREGVSPRGIFVADLISKQVDELRPEGEMLLANPVGVTADSIIVAGTPISAPIPADHLASIALTGKRSTLLPTPPNLSFDEVRMTHDHQSITWLGGDGAVWRASLGEGRPTRIATSPPNSRIRSYDLSSDGRLALGIDNPTASDAFAFDLRH